MKILSQNLKRREVKVKIDNVDDLWYLSHIIDKGDLVKGQTLRKIKIGEDERKAKIVKRWVFIVIEVEKTEFKENLIKVLGKVVECPEDVKKGSYHSFNIEKDSVIAIIKDKWLRFQLDRLKEASAAEQPEILICVLDREESIFALSKRKGYEILSSLKGDVSKKDIDISEKEGFYSEIIKKLEEYVKRFKLKNIIVASPAFWKEELLKRIKSDELKKKIVSATCSSVGTNAIDEVLKRPEIREVLLQMRATKEVKLVEDVLVEISKKGEAAYGIKEVENAANAGAVKTLLVSDSLIQKMREKDKYDVLDNIMRIVESTKGEIHIIISEHEGGKKLDGLGGIAALLRYRIN